MPYSVSPQRNLQQLQPADVEAEIELLALHAAELGDQEMAQLVDENHQPQADGDLRMATQVLRPRRYQQRSGTDPT